MKQDFNYRKPKIQRYDFNYNPPEIKEKKFPELSGKYKVFRKPNIEKRVRDSENFEWKTN